MEGLEEGQPSLERGQHGSLGLDLDWGWIVFALTLNVNGKLDNNLNLKFVSVLHEASLLQGQLVVV